MKTIIVNTNDAGQRLDKFLFKYIDNIPSGLLYRYIRTKRIKVNQKKSEIGYKLLEGDVVDLYLNDEFFQNNHKSLIERYSFMNPKLDIVYEDSNILLVNKPTGMLVHDDDTEQINTLISHICAYLYQKGEYDPGKENSFAPALCNRIDRNTSGIVICAKTAQSLRILNEKIKARQLEKYYLCIATGILQKKQGVLDGYLIKDANNNTVKIIKHPTADAKTILTKYRVIKQSGDLSLVEVLLITGRTHQIRAHFASIGHPLLGDGKYGKNTVNKQYGIAKQALCSYRLIFRFDGPPTALEYLNNREFAVDNVDFADEFFA